MSTSDTSAANRLASALIEAADIADMGRPPVPCFRRDAARLLLEQEAEIKSLRAKLKVLTHAE